jgi:LEA14-like dessication related protein
MPIGIKDYSDFTLVDSSPYNVKSSDQRLSVDTSTLAISIILPTNQLNPNRLDLTIKDISGNATTNNITISTEGSEKIDGQDTAIINGNYDSITIYNDGSNWFIK